VGVSAGAGLILAAAGGRSGWLWRLQSIAKADSSVPILFGTLEFFGTHESFSEGKRACWKVARPKGLAHLIGTVPDIFG
jgi:hypothetical protein